MVFEEAGSEAFCFSFVSDIVNFASSLAVSSSVCSVAVRVVLALVDVRIVAVVGAVVVLSFDVGCFRGGMMVK